MLSLAFITNELLSIFSFYVSILAFMFVVISFMTGQERLKTKSFANPEDAERHGNPAFCRINSDVERLRRICRNDLENIPMFIVIALLYASTGPAPYFYALLLRSYSGLRIAYTVAYKCKARAPIRSILYCLSLYFIHLPMLLIVMYSSVVQ